MRSRMAAATAPAPTRAASPTVLIVALPADPCRASTRERVMSSTLSSTIEAGARVIIHCHGPYTTAPPSHTAWRRRQLAAYDAGTSPTPYTLPGDDEIRASLEENQLRLAAERGIGHTLFSPRASAMGHHLGDLKVSRAWAEAN